MRSSIPKYVQKISNRSLLPLKDTKCQTKNFQQLRSSLTTSITQYQIRLNKKYYRYYHISRSFAPLQMCAYGARKLHSEHYTSSNISTLLEQEVQLLHVRSNEFNIYKYLNIEAAKIALAGFEYKYKTSIQHLYKSVPQAAHEYIPSS